MRTTPSASVIVVASDGVEPLRPLLARLAVQSALRDLELVIAAPESDIETLKALLDYPLEAVQIVAADLTTSARARVAGIRAARAPIVILAEDHAFPVTDDWAERLIAAHRGPYAAVGPVVENANPKTALSWANLAIEYGQWLHVDCPGEVDFVPGHNSAYKRDILLSFGDRLVDLMEAEYVLHRELRAKGERLYLDPSIRVAHLNYAFFRPAVVLQFHGGRVFAASRAARWSPLRRAGYAAAFPAIALVRLARITAGFGKAPPATAPPSGTTLMCATLALVSAFGEGLGYAMGDGGRRNPYARLEYRRWRNVLPDEWPTNRAVAS